MVIKFKDKLIIRGQPFKTIKKKKTIKDIRELDKKFKELYKDSF